MARRVNVVPYSRSYRKPPKFGMGLPPRRPRRRIWRRLAFVAGSLVAAAVLSVYYVPRSIDAAVSMTKNQTGCHVWQIVDGDTVTLTCPSSGYGRGRLLGFDTPEVRARCTRELWLATRATYTLRWWFWTAGIVSATAAGEDRYGRRLVRLRLDDRDVGHALIQAGLARPYSGGKRQGWCG